MKNLFPFAAFALLVAACSGGGADTTTTTTSAATTVASTAATTTTVASTTTTAAATTTTASAADLARAAVAELAGTYEGEWRNLTFGSSGPISIEMTAGSDGLEVVTDLGGPVFGEGDPDPETFTLPYETLATGSSAGESALFGPFTFTVAGGQFTFEAPAVPSAGIASMTVQGELADGTISGTYEIAFDGGGGANGEFEATRTS